MKPSSLKLMLLIAAGFLPWAMGAHHAPGERQPCHFCKRHCDPCELCPVTVRCPTPVIETQMKSRIVKEWEDREETYTVFERKPETLKFKKKVCYLADEIVSKEITEVDCKRVRIPVEKTFSVDVPVKEIHEGTRTRKICTKCGVECVTEPCQCVLTRIHKEMDFKQSDRGDVVFETSKRTIDYCKKVPTIKEEFCAEEVVYKLVPVEKKRKVQVCVPKIEKYACDVKVTKMLPYEVQCCQACRELRAKQQKKSERDGFLQRLHPDCKVCDHQLKEKLQKLHEHDPKLAEKLKEHHAKRDHKLLEKLQEKHAERHGQGSCDCDDCRY